jgi:hypothetical protein
MSRLNNSPVAGSASSPSPVVDSLLITFISAVPMLVGLPTWLLPESKRLLMREVIVRQIPTPLPVLCHHLFAFVDIV